MPPCRYPQAAGTGAAAPGYLKQGWPHTCPKPCPLPCLPYRPITAKLPDTSPQLWGFLACQALASSPESPACVSRMTV
ncbi:hypothetical protein ACF3NW_00370 [Eikenella halliae]|uniref:hypothetical protein n=1 Tax=Eikenella halliae TaxID=1795832 RepID=UPI0028D3FAD9|nr:hypothetical protein [Eikenella halliae]